MWTERSNSSAFPLRLPTKGLRNRARLKAGVGPIYWSPGHSPGAYLSSKEHPNAFIRRASSPRSDAAQPNHCFSHVRVFEHGRLRHGLAFGPSRKPRRRRSILGFHGSLRCIARGPHQPERRIPKSPVTFDAKDSEFLMHVLAGRNSLLISNTAVEAGWVGFKGFSHLRSWSCVPLVASQQVLGLLSLGDSNTQAFTQEHLRLAKSLAIPAAVAIQKARLYEQAEIFRAELEQRLADLEQAEKVLREVRQGGELS